MRSPVAVVPHVFRIDQAPITGSPQPAERRCQNPGARNPVVILVVPGIRPVTRGPNVPGCGTGRLHVHGQRRWCESDGYSDAKKSREGCGWIGDCEQHDEKRTMDELGVHGSLLLKT